MKRKEAGGRRKRKKGLLSIPVRSEGQKEREREKGQEGLKRRVVVAHSSSKVGLR